MELEMVVGDRVTKIELGNLFGCAFGLEYNAELLVNGKWDANNQWHAVGPQLPITKLSSLAIAVNSQLGTQTPAVLDHRCPAHHCWAHHSSQREESTSKPGREDPFSYGVFPEPSVDKS